jgi:hypothetical protein
MVICPLFGKRHAILCCLLLVKLSNVYASSSLSREVIESFTIDTIPGGGSSSHYTNDLKKASIKFKKTQDREHRVQIFKKGCSEEISNDDTYIDSINSSSESIIPNTNNVEFDVEMTFRSNIQNTDLFTIIEEDSLEEDLAQIEVCVRVDVFYVNPADSSDRVSLNFKEVEFIWTIRLDTIGVFNLDVGLRGENYKKFGIGLECITATNYNNDNPKHDTIGMCVRNEYENIQLRTDEMEVQWLTSFCESSIDLNITTSIDLNETADELELFGTYKHSDLVRSSLFETLPGVGGKVRNLCAKVSRHYNPENMEFGPSASRDACVCMDLYITIESNSRLLIEQDMLVAKSQQGQHINELSRFLNDAEGYWNTTLENITLSYTNPYDREPTPFVTSVGLSYTTSTCQCDENYECVDNLTLSQGSIMYICLKVENAQDVIIGGVTEFDIKQQQSDSNFTYSPINNNVRDGLTVVIFQGQKAIIKHQLISRYFSDANPGPLDASGSMVLNFASTSNPSRNRMIRRLVEWKIPSEVENNQGEDGSRGLFARVLGQRNQWSVEVVLTGSSTSPAAPDGTNTTGSTTGVVRNQLLIVLGVSTILAFVTVGIVIWRFERNDDQNGKANEDDTSPVDIDVGIRPQVVGKSLPTLSGEESENSWILT